MLPPAEANELPGIFTNLRKESTISLNMEMTIKDEQLKNEMKKVEELGGKLAGMRKKKSKPL